MEIETVKTVVQVSGVKVVFQGLALCFSLLGMVQEDYHSQNPYHNAVHAADVTQAMYCYLREPKVMNNTVFTHTRSASLYLSYSHCKTSPG